MGGEEGVSGEEVSKEGAETITEGIADDLEVNKKGFLLFLLSLLSLLSLLFLLLLLFLLYSFHCNWV